MVIINTYVGVYIPVSYFCYFFPVPGGLHYECKLSVVKTDTCICR